MKRVYLIGGPNGTGKTTLAKKLIQKTHLSFVNADEIAYAINPARIDKVRVTAGKSFFKKINDHIQSQESFILESTLSGKYLKKIIDTLKNEGYKVVLIYLFLQHTEECFSRIHVRVKKGGHFVPEEDVKRRFFRSKFHFWNLYRYIVDEWWLAYNASQGFTIVAFGKHNTIEIIEKSDFNLFQEGL